MRFILSTQELNYLVNKVLGVVSAKPTIPLLANFLIEVANNELILSATDLTVGIRCQTEVKVLEEGATTVPAKHFSSLVRELTSMHVEIHTDENELTTVVSDASNFKIHGMSREDFPSLPDITEAISFSISQSVLYDMLYRTCFAVSREDNRYVLTGVNLMIADGIAVCTGTDGKRLARAYAKIEIDPSFKGNFIIPLKTVEEILKNLKEEGEAKVYLMPDKIAIEASQTMIVTKLLSGEYPDIDRVIPENSEFIISLHREELMTLLRQVSLFVTEENCSVRFTFNKGELKLSANAMVGEGKVSMPVNYQGEPFDIAFNPHFFMDILRRSKEEAVTMGITDAFNPGVVTDTGNIEAISLAQTPLFVLMPMRLHQET